MVGERSWTVRATPGGLSEDGDSDAPWGEVALHRVPLGTGYDVVWEADAGDRIPASALGEVLVHDRLAPGVPTPMGERAEDEETTLLIVEPLWLREDMWAPGVGEFLLASALAELMSGADIGAVAQPVPDHLRGRARTVPKARQTPVFEYVGFERFTTQTWLLADLTPVGTKVQETGRALGLW